MVKKRLSNIFFFTPDGVRARVLKKTVSYYYPSDAEGIYIEVQHFNVCG